MGDYVSIGNDPNELQKIKKNLVSYKNVTVVSGLKVQLNILNRQDKVDDDFIYLITKRYY